jgi:Family of unknown function (DUF5313)
MRRRPTPFQWLWYAIGGRLPAGLNGWVRHDLTDADWRLRELIRVLVQALPGCVIFLLLPAPTEIRVLAVALVLIGAVSVALLYGTELRDRRLRQHHLKH